MLRWVSMTLWTLAALTAAAFLNANRSPVVISLDPFAPENPALTLPPMQLWMVILLALFVGFFIGAVGMWASGRGVRRRAGERKREIRGLKKEVRQATEAAAGGANLPAVR